MPLSKAATRERDCETETPTSRSNIVTAANTLAKNAPDASLYKPFESKQELCETIRDSLVGVDKSRLADLLLRLSASLSSVWPDPDFVAN